MKDAKKITRKTLARYAGLLGRDSLAKRALDDYDTSKAAGQKPIITMRNNGFTVQTHGVRVNYG